MLFGDKGHFAIECQLTSVSNDWVFANFCFWIAGSQVGDFADTMLLRPGTERLKKFLLRAKERQAKNFDGQSKEEVFAAIFDAAMLTVPQGIALHDYLRTSHAPEPNLTTAEQRSLIDCFHLDPVGMSAFADKWNIVLLEQADGAQRIIWRSLQEMTLHEITLPAALFNQVAGDFLKWVDK